MPFDEEVFRMRSTLRLTALPIAIFAITALTNGRCWLWRREDRSVLRQDSSDECGTGRVAATKQHAPRFVVPPVGISVYDGPATAAAANRGPTMCGCDDD